MTEQNSRWRRPYLDKIGPELSWAAVTDRFAAPSTATCQFHSALGQLYPGIGYFGRLNSTRSRKDGVDAGGISSPVSARILGKVRWIFSLLSPLTRRGTRMCWREVGALLSVEFTHYAIL